MARTKLQMDTSVLWVQWFRDERVKPEVLRSSSSGYERVFFAQKITWLVMMPVTNGRLLTKWVLRPKLRNPFISDLDACHSSKGLYLRQVLVLPLPGCLDLHSSSTCFHRKIHSRGEDLYVHNKNNVQGRISLCIIKIMCRRGSLYA
jgi:hypothetical protein